MTDLKLEDGTVTIVTPAPPIVITATGLTAFVVPTGFDPKIQVKAWGAGGGGGGRGEESAGGNGGGAGFIHLADIVATAGETLNVTIGTGGAGGPGSTDSDVAGDGGGGAGRTFVERATGSVLLAEPGGGAGGGGGSNHIDNEQDAGDGARGGGATGETGQAPDAALNTSGGVGGTQSAGGVGGTGQLSGSAGSSLTGGAGADGSGTPIGTNPAGGVPGGGQGGAYDVDSPGGGGGAAGPFGGGGGGSGKAGIAAPESGAGGGAGSNFTSGTLVLSERGDEQIAGGVLDPDYPGNSVGMGGLRGLGTGGNESGTTGFPGAVVFIFSTSETFATQNDLVITDAATVDLVSGADEIIQHVKAVLLTCQGEWFLDLAHGTPWFTRVIGQRFNAGQINITVRDAILSVAGVASITDISSERGLAPRSAKVSVEVLTDDGAKVTTVAEIF